VQTSAYARYHIIDPDNCVTQEDAWRVARDPGTAGADPSTPVTDTAGQATGEQRAPRIAPYYQLLQLPNSENRGGLPESPEMVLMRSFVPESANDRRQQLTAFMAARMEPGHYGELLVYQMPSGHLPDGPGLAAAAISSDDAVSVLETQLGSGGSEVRLGNLLLVPIDNALVYVQPFYVVSEDENRQLPQLERVVAVFGDQVAIENTLSDALGALFNQDVSTQEHPGTNNQPGGGSDGGEGGGEGTPQGTAAEQAGRLLAQAQALFNQADADLKRTGDLGQYQDTAKEARDKLDQATAILADAGAQGGGSGSTTTSTTKPAQAA
jgi:uncharacterized membrane protein (UPF0182 family)